MAEPVTLERIKADAKLAGIALIKQSRLSVMPLRAREFRRVLQLGKTKL
jgi:predicted RNA-binding protein with PUA-like domain